jgi:GTPase
MERTMIQNEVVDDEDGNPVAVTDSKPIVVQEPPTWSISGSPGQVQSLDNGTPGEDQAIEDPNHSNQQQVQVLRKGQEQNGQGVYTRAELVIHRIETHLLDPSPISLEELAQSVDAMTLQESPTASASNNSFSNGESNTENVMSIQNNPNHDKTKSVENLSIAETLSSRNIRIAVVGNVDAGKSTLIGTLTTSCLDDGRGKSRTSIMKHRHEIESGRTSTATTHLMGFRSTGEPIAGRDQVRAMKRKSEDEIARESYRVITLMDLAGHEKYLKTTIHGVSSGFADHALILVNARHPPTHMTQHHLNLCCSFGIPVIIVFTKIDGCPEHAFKVSKEGVIKMLRSPEVQRTPYTVKNEQDVSMVIDKLHTLAPMIETSCVSGEGIELLQKLLFSLPKRRRHENKVHRSFEFLVEDIFNVPGVGAVVSGFVNAGELTVGSNVYVGPTDDGTFMRTVAKSAHIARINTSHVTSGQSACLAFALNKELRKKLRRGMVVLKENPTSTLQFDAEICVLKGEGTTIRRSYQAYVHILNVRQSAFARNIEIVNNHAVGLPTSHSTSRGDKEGEEDVIVLRPGSRAKVTFEFAKRPEYIRPGMRMLFRDGRVRGVGIITSIPAAGIAKG